MYHFLEFFEYSYRKAERISLYICRNDVGISVRTYVITELKKKKNSKYNTGICHYFKNPFLRLNYPIYMVKMIEQVIEF